MALKGKWQPTGAICTSRDLDLIHRAYAIKAVLNVLCLLHNINRMVSRFLPALVFILCALSWVLDVAARNPPTVAHILLPGLVQVWFKSELALLIPEHRSSLCWSSPCYSTIIGLLTAPAQAFLRPTSERLFFTELPDPAVLFPLFKDKPLSCLQTP